MKPLTTYQICTRCVMDTSDLEITFNKKGVCNHCDDYDILKKKFTFKDNTDRIGEFLYHSAGSAKEVNNLINMIKIAGKNKPYDCVIGMSGGIDSSYVAYKAIEFGLRPIAFHIDNEWDSQIAIDNLSKLTTKLNIPITNIKVEWEEFKDLQLSFLKSSTPDVEVPTDHAVIAVPYKFAREHKVNYIITGYNYRTETHIPRSWSSPGQPDWVYISKMHKKFGAVPLTTFAYITPIQYVLQTLYSPIKKIDLLNYLDYNKQEAYKLLHDKFQYNYYGAKHWESLYTRFLQTYILPRKFGYDKRKSHLSSLICSGFMTREDALKELATPPLSPEELERDKQYFIQKFGITEEYFEELMNLPQKTYWDYPHSNFFDSKIIKFVAKNILKKRGL